MTPATLGPTPFVPRRSAHRKRRLALQVEGCGLDLSSLRYFFRKQRICGKARCTCPLGPRPPPAPTPPATLPSPCQARR